MYDFFLLRKYTILLTSGFSTFLNYLVLYWIKLSAFKVKIKWLEPVSSHDLCRQNRETDVLETKIKLVSLIPFQTKESYIFILGSFNRKLKKRTFETLFPDCFVYSLCLPLRIMKSWPLANPPSHIFDVHLLENTNLSPSGEALRLSLFSGFYIKIMFCVRWFYSLFERMRFYRKKNEVYSH